MAETERNQDQAAAGVSYAYKAKLIGAAQQFGLTDQGLSWRVGPHAGLWPYSAIAQVRLSYRPVSMQSRRFRADIRHVDGGRLRILSTTWQTVALVAPQDAAYRAFIVELHQRMRQAGSRAELLGGLPASMHTAALVVTALLATALTALLARAVATGSWSGALFIAGFIALFAWQIGGFLRRNRPRRYTLDALPNDLLP